MNALQFSFLLIRRPQRAVTFVSGNAYQRRYKYKPKWATNLKFSNCQRALDHFDAFYSPIYGALWPSIRLSLLSLPKHSAVVNKYSDPSKVGHRLEKVGSFNVLKRVRNKFPVIQFATDNINHSLDLNQDNRIEFDSLHVQNEQINSSVNNSINRETNENGITSPSKLTYVLEGDSLEPYDEDLYKDNLNVYVPPELMITEKDKQLEEELRANTFQPGDIDDVDTLPMDPIVLSTDLDAFVFPSGDVSKFPQPKVFNQASGYYLMDAASLMPVFALNLCPSDRVLDLCAAPGGKTFVMLQTVNFEHGGVLHCNDSSASRISRLKNVIKSYIPPSIAKDIVVTQRDGQMFDTPMYDKVLVDVPCSTDRHVVTEEDNNLFKPSRSHERFQMMKRQRDLLVSAIKSCIIGGSVVYSTCTLAAAQNDGVIQAAMEVLRENTQIDVAVQDLSPLTDAFEGSFTFYGRCRYGQLILPSLSQNFGPLYFAKLQRIR